MRYIRYREDSGEVRIAIEQPHEASEGSVVFHGAKSSDLVDGLANGFSPSGDSVVADPELLWLRPDHHLLVPVDAPEIWCAGVTYEPSLEARVLESQAPELYESVFEAHRPELFLKDAGCRRTVGPGEPIGIRGDSTWTVPEPELGLVVGEHGKIVGYTIGNDVSCRDIAGANPLYLPQAKTFHAACAIGPAVYVEPGRRKSFSIYMHISDEQGNEVYSAKTSTSKMRRTFRELVEWLTTDNPVPPGSILLTGTGLVPPEDFTLRAGYLVEIHVPEIGTLANPVKLASEISLYETLVGRVNASVYESAPELEASRPFPSRKRFRD
jgi:2-dehydro-3-deoxy-D-arabinonate dehydratase